MCSSTIVYAVSATTLQGLRNKRYSEGFLNINVVHNFNIVYL